MENKISNHIENSPFSLINREAALRPVKIESDLISLVEELKELSEKTEGYYDFAFTGIKPNRVLDDSEFRKV